MRHTAVCVKALLVYVSCAVRYTSFYCAYTGYRTQTALVGHADCSASGLHMWCGGLIPLIALRGAGGQHCAVH